MDFTKNPVIFFILTSIILLIYYIYIFTSKTNIFPISETCCWLSSTIIALLIVNSLYQAEKFLDKGKIIYIIIIYLLLIACTLCSLGMVWNITIVPEIKLRFDK
jgi:hypothetical protein